MIKNSFDDVTIDNSKKDAGVFTLHSDVDVNHKKSMCFTSSAITFIDGTNLTIAEVINYLHNLIKMH
jgi:hypothetical protein